MPTMFFTATWRRRERAQVGRVHRRRTPRRRDRPASSHAQLGVAAIATEAKYGVVTLAVARLAAEAVPPFMKGSIAIDMKATSTPTRGLRTNPPISPPFLRRHFDHAMVRRGLPRVEGPWPRVSPCRPRSGAGAGR